MRKLQQLLLRILIVFSCLCQLTWTQDTGSASIDGIVNLGQAPGTTLVVRLYSPKSMANPAQQSANPAPRRVRVAFLSTDGHFQFSNLRPGSYLLEIYSGDRLLYQKVVSTQDSQPLQISLNLVTSQPLVFQTRDWQPLDMTSDVRSGIFVLDKSGAISKIVVVQNAPRIDPVFHLKSVYQGYALSAAQDAIYVLAESKQGCFVVRYSFVDKKSSDRVVAEPKLGCAGIATDGNAIYVTIPPKKEIRYFTSWSAPSYQTWALNDADALGPLFFDKMGHRLLVGDTSGRAYSILVPNGSRQLLASNLGWINSMAVSQRHILVASGTKILSLARSDGHGENPPSGLNSLTGGHIEAVVVDGNDRVWFADYDNKLVRGPLPLD